MIPRHLLDEARHAGQRPGRIGFQAKREREVKHNLRVGRAQDVPEELRGDRHQQVASQLLDLEDLAVVDEQPVPVAEGVAIRLLHRGQRGRAHMGEEKV